MLIAKVSRTILQISQSQCGSLGQIRGIPRSEQVPATAELTEQATLNLLHPVRK